MLIYVAIIPVFVIFILSIFIILSFKKDHFNEVRSTSMVSVLVAARNEEATIISCLESLSKLKYDNFEVLVGNDHSEDSTLALVTAFCEDNPQFTVVDIVETLGEARGKSNVLAQLAHKARGDFFFITDADTNVPKGWIEAMLSGFDEKTGIVTGMTSLRAKSPFEWFQQIDWIYALSLVKSVTDLGFPVTSMGNNMALKREAYYATGGYENLPFSITEDFQLFREIIKKSWKYKNLFHKEVLAYSKPISSFKRLMHQRKRWMIGAMQLPWHFLTLLYAQAGFYPAIVVLLFISIKLAALLFLSKLLVQVLYITRAYHRLEQKVSVLQLLAFEFYSGVVAISLLLFYFTPVKVNWKGRKY